MNKTIRHSLTTLLLLSSFLLLGCGGCAATEKQGKPLSEDDKKILASFFAPKQAHLKAGNVFAYLVFNRALQQGQEKNIVAALKALTSYNPPAPVYIDAGIWALENTAQGILPLIEVGLEKHNTSVSLHLLYAELLQKFGKSKKAIAHIEDFLQKNPHEIDAQVELALLLANENEFTKAETIFLNIQEKDRTGLVDYYHAKTLLGLNRKKEALNLLEKSVEKTPEFVEALNDLAFLYEQNREFAKARDTYEKMLSNYGANYELLLRIIMLSLRLNEPEKALEYFESNPMTPELTVAVASMFLEAKNYDMAEPILLGLAELDKAPQDLYFYLAAIAYERDNNPKKAYDWLIKIDEKNKAYGRALFLRLQLLLDLGKPEQALQDARKGIARAPEEPQFWISEIRVLGILKKYDEAVKKVLNIMRKWPDNMEIAYLHASLLDQAGKKDAAFAAMEDIIKRQPDYFQALNYIGYSLAEQSKDLQRAIQLLRKANSLSPNSNHILDSLAWALYKNGNTQEAWDVISQAVAANGYPEPTIWEHYGDIANTLGKKDEARKGYTKALEFTPTNANTITYKLNHL